MICSRIFAGVDQSILRSTRNPLLNQDDSKCTTSRSSAARSLFSFISVSKSVRIATRSLVPPGGASEVAPIEQKHGAVYESFEWVLLGQRRAEAPQDGAAEFGYGGPQVGEKGVGHGQGRCQ